MIILGEEREAVDSPALVDRLSPPAQLADGGSEGVARGSCLFNPSPPRCFVLDNACAIVEGIAIERHALGQMGLSSCAKRRGGESHVWGLAQLP